MLGLLSRRMYTQARATLRRLRKPGWRRLERLHIAAHPVCEACGGKASRQVHHIVPIHVDPTRELDPDNLITLCMGPIECHLRVGHRGTWLGANPSVRRHASELRAVLDAAHTCEAPPPVGNL